MTLLEEIELTIDIYGLEDTELVIAMAKQICRLEFMPNYRYSGSCKDQLMETIASKDTFNELLDVQTGVTCKHLDEFFTF